MNILATTAVAVAWSFKKIDLMVWKLFAKCLMEFKFKNFEVIFFSMLKDFEI